MAKHKTHLADDVVTVSEDELLAFCTRAKAALNEDDATFLHKLIAAYAQLQKLIAAKNTTVARLRRLFGLRQSEKTRAVLSATTQPQHPAENGADRSPSTDPPSPPAADPGDNDKRPKRGHGRNGAKAYSGAEQITVSHDSLTSGDRCPQGCGGKVYPWADAKTIIRIYGQSPIAARVYTLEALRCNLCQQLYHANVPPSIAAKKKVDESAAAILALLHYGMGLPFYRLDKLQQMQKVPLPASTQWEIVNGYAPMLMPILDHMVALAADGQVLHNDDTTARILSLMGQQRQKKLHQGLLDKPHRSGLFTTGIVSQQGPRKIALFYIGRDHAGENIAKVLARRSNSLGPPIQMCDGLAANVAHMMQVIQANCLAHGRRPFVDQVANFPAECRKLLETLGRVFHHETHCKQNKLEPHQRLAYHQHHSAPLMSDLKVWIDDLLDNHKIEPNSALGAPLTYLQSRWDKLTVFLRVANAPLDNNIVERALKRAILQRKNSLFYKTEHGAQVAGLYTSLIYTAELNGADPLDYLVSLMRHPDAITTSPASLMPWNYKLALAASHDCAVAA